MKKHISSFHYLSDSLEGKSHATLCDLACKGGARWVQLRVKNQDELAWKNIAHEAQKTCIKYGATFIINDNVSLAKDLDADGVHLGEHDLSISEARKILGPNKIIGGTANTIEEIITLANKGVDYIGLGPYKFTETKNNLKPILGLKRIQKIVQQKKQDHDLKVPLIAIGGINIEDVSPILESGIDGVAVSSAINQAASVEIASKLFVKKLNLSNEIKNCDTEPNYC